MTTKSLDRPTAGAAVAASDRSLYRAIWRWHFYAVLLSIPFMLLLALTGSLYLFKNDINATVFAYRNIVPSHAAGVLPPGELLQRAAAAVPGGTPTAYRDPADATASAVVTVAADGGDRLVFLDPGSGRVLDIVPARQEFNQVVRKVHSLDYFGTLPNRLIEAIGGFALVLTASGIYLWWPRGRSGGVVSVRGRPGQRVFWRDLHAVTGALAGVLILFLAGSGLFWSGYWGDKFNRFATWVGQGFPAAMWDDVPSSSVPAKDALGQVGWTVENSPMPESTPPAEGGSAPIGIDRAVAIVRQQGMRPGFDLALPDGETGVYTASIFPIEAPAQERMIHLDQYSGRTLVDVGFADYGALAQAVEVGTDIHMGGFWGRANQALMVLAALAVVLSSVSAVTMWWKRRPRGRLGVPPYPAERRVYVGLWAVAILFGLLFPISGLAILAMLALDLLVVRTIPPLRRAFA
ncbi:MAG: PepSY domain-containing protein [Dongiaceae bacterium]